MRRRISALNDFEPFVENRQRADRRGRGPPVRRAPLSDGQPTHASRPRERRNWLARRPGARAGPRVVARVLRRDTGDTDLLGTTRRPTRATPSAVMRSPDARSFRKGALCRARSVRGRVRGGCARRGYVSDGRSPLAVRAPASPSMREAARFSVPRALLLVANRGRTSSVVPSMRRTMQNWHAPG
jgi:hypothetical protein